MNNLPPTMRRPAMSAAEAAPAPAPGTGFAPAASHGPAEPPAGPATGGRGLTGVDAAAATAAGSGATGAVGPMVVSRPPPAVPANHVLPQVA